MIILAFDTSADLASIAIRRAGSLLAETAIPAQEGHAHIIFPALQQLLLKAGITLQQVNCFAAAHGPGSFTGVRVALAIVKGLAETCAKPAIGVSNLRALAAAGTKPLRSPVIDARRGEVYAAVYNHSLELIQPETVTSLEIWKQTIHPDIELISEIPPAGLASAVALCADLDGPALWKDPASLDAFYIRRDDANSFWRDPANET